MDKNKIALLFSFVMSLFSFDIASAQDTNHTHYLGISPSILAEPYDKVDAIEINTFPFVYEFRLSDDLGIQFRSTMNYRFSKVNAGISHTGGTIVLNKYFWSLMGNDFWITPQIAVFSTYAYNQIDKTKTTTFGIELGAFMKLADQISMNINLQPGINYYPDTYSREFVNAKDGFKPHFGIVFHIGYHF